MPFLMTLDQTMTVLSDVPDQAALDRVAYGSREKPYAASNLSRWLADVDENPIPGTDDLRAAFRDERLRLGGDCTSCQLAALTAKYRQALETMGHSEILHESAR